MDTMINGVREEAGVGRVEGAMSGGGIGHTSVIMSKKINEAQSLP